MKAIATRIMVIRHAEKPVGDYKGVTATGEVDKYSLIVKGWQRAGALTALFDPFDGPMQNKFLSKPDVLYASVPGKQSNSKRPLETITPLSERLGLSINLKFGKGDYKTMADSAMTESGVVLISWQHQDIPHIANHILTNNVSPQKWPSDRFDIVWVFDLNTSSGEYKFNQVPQNLLEGDSNKPIS